MEENNKINELTEENRLLKRKIKFLEQAFEQFDKIKLNYDKSLINLKKKDNKLTLINSELEKKSKELERLSEALKIKIKEVSKEKAVAERARKKAKKALKSKSEFLANMSHEIRTPLNAIMGFIELLEEKEKDNKKASYLKIINSSSQNLLTIINDILDFSKIESGNLTLEQLDFNPKEELLITEKLFDAKCLEKNIQLHINLQNLPNTLNGDVLRIKQVINNLLSNAIKFTDNNKNIYLTAQYQKGLLKISIKDEGIGISKRYQKNIFSAFSQEDTSTTRRYGGTGLGLAISNNLIKAMGSKLKIKSKLKKGSEFYFSIPLKTGKIIKKEIHSNNNEEKLKGHILIVEDNKANQMFLKIILKKMNLSFDTANNGKEALDIFKNNLLHYSCILMDENMPIMSGTTATKKMRLFEKKKALKSTPIIALTANALKGDREKFLDSGMDDYLSKPLNKKDLFNTLKKYLIKRV